VYTATFTRPELFSTATPTLSLPAPGGWDGVEGKLVVAFDSAALGTLEAQLVLSSDGGGGSYVVPIAASTLAPAPVGPFAVPAGGAPTALNFKSPFLEDAEFTVTSDSPAVFTPSTMGAVSVGKKAPLGLTVKYAASGANPPAVGRVIVTHTKGGGVKPGAQWVFFLQKG